MLTIKKTTLLPINCYYGISVLAKNEAVLISIPRYTVFSVYRPTLLVTAKVFQGMKEKTSNRETFSPRNKSNIRYIVNKLFK